MKDSLTKYSWILSPGTAIAAALLFVAPIIVDLQNNKETLIAADESMELRKLQEIVKKEQERVSNKKALTEFTLTVMDMEPKTKASLAKRAAIAEKIAEFTLNGLPNQDSREHYISMIKIESNFENAARSPVGAQGIGQIMPGTFNGTMVKLNTGIKSEDIHNEDINLMVGVFYFNELLLQQKGNPRLASIAYNGGGRTAEKFKKLVDINKETANYSLKADHVKETTRSTIISKSE